ncbi:hypothetical protein [Phycicoccus sp.]|uniref:hypothetical protein n=1 Tax=Phycicoccus sp. TaxID=1902410 RepID=UPI002C5C975D|nr:hypothetical protein [Phycicoccus sp.]HMM95385.1 hypothetical protein [Phycicoccus sp.]
MSEQQSEVGAAMWGGRRWPEGRPKVARESVVRALPDGLVAALVSLFLVVIGGSLIGIGAGLLWGLGAGLLATGAVVLLVGLLLGVK